MPVICRPWLRREPRARLIPLPPSRLKNARRLGPRITVQSGHSSKEKAQDLLVPAGRLRAILAERARHGRRTTEQVAQAGRLRVLTQAQPAKAVRQPARRLAPSPLGKSHLEPNLLAPSLMKRGMHQGAPIPRGRRPPERTGQNRRQAGRRARSQGAGLTARDQPHPGPLPASLRQGAAFLASREGRSRKASSGRPTSAHPLTVPRRRVASRRTSTMISVQ